MSGTDRGPSTQGSPGSDSGPGILPGSAREAVRGQVSATADTGCGGRAAETSEQGRNAGQQHGQNLHRQDACATGQDACAAVELHAFDPQVEVEVRERNLPHWRQAGKMYFVTFRLGDSLPQSVLRALREERQQWLDRHPRPWPPELLRDFRRLFSRRVEEYLHAGYGECVLRSAGVAAVVASAMRHFDEQRYQLDDYVIMPNHVHVLVAPHSGWALSSVLHSWKSFTANQINRMLGRKGRLWQDESYDHIVRDEDEFIGYRRYMAANPDSAGLRPDEYLLSSKIER